MASFFKKALSVFVEFDEDQKQNSTADFPQMATGRSETPRELINHAEAEKFEKYFDKLFEQANFPGPDYFEFYKMMETLEAHIPSEDTRLAATFASLSIQGLTKYTLIDTASKYKSIIEKDKNAFDLALSQKLKEEVGERQSELKNLEEKIETNSEQIQRLTREISESQTQIGKLKTEILDEENKLTKNSQGYQLASQAIISKINSDIQKIQSSL